MIKTGVLNLDDDDDDDDDDDEHIFFLNLIRRTTFERKDSQDFQ